MLEEALKQENKPMNILYYRPKLDYENRLLFKSAWYKDQYYLLLLEVIYKHKHEIRSENPYNKKLFKRLYRGYYELNPDQAVWVNDQWRNVYSMMQSVEVSVPTQAKKDVFIKAYYQQIREQEEQLREENIRLREENNWASGRYDED